MSETFRIRGYAVRPSGSGSQYATFLYFRSGLENSPITLAAEDTVTLDSIVISAPSTAHGWLFYSDTASNSNEARRLIPFGAGSTAYTPSHPVAVPHISGVLSQLRLFADTGTEISAMFYGRVTRPS